MLFIAPRIPAIAKSSMPRENSSTAIPPRILVLLSLFVALFTFLISLTTRSAPCASSVNVASDILCYIFSDS